MHCGIDFDRSIAEMCYQIIADNHSRLFTIAEIELFLCQQSQSLTIADDCRISERCFHIMADDRCQHFQRSDDRERSYGN